MDIEKYQYPYLIDIFSKTNEYPPQFPNLKKTIYRIESTEISWKKLEPNAWLDDNLINCFLRLLRDSAAANGMKVLVFDTFFVLALLRKDGLSVGYKSWLSKNEIWDKDVWLLPINNNNVHWTLLIVVVADKKIVYIDSMHNDPPPQLIKKVGLMMESVSMCKKSKNIQKPKWEQWTVHTPSKYRVLGQ